VASDLTDWIAGVMREDYEALGFLSFQAINDYVEDGNYVIQTDDRGRRLGYILHGPIRYGQPVTIVQHCIVNDFRRRGNGAVALAEVVRRGHARSASLIRLRCATELDALGFWQSQGFHASGVTPGGKRRGRELTRLWLPLAQPLFDAAPQPAQLALEASG